MSEIYLISPQQITLKQFSYDLVSALETGLIPLFQLRLKNYEDKEVIKIATELRKICSDFDVKFIVNDSYKIALKARADGVHVGVDDDDIKSIKQIVGNNFIIGASCYDKKNLALSATTKGATQISFGAFFSSITKTSRGKPSPEILTWAKQEINLPIVAIGGINDENCSILVESGADYLAVISYVWQHEKGIEYAIKKMHNIISK